jgi:hypothetical protein
MILLRLAGRTAPLSGKSGRMQVADPASRKARASAGDDCGCLAFIAGLLIWSTRKN